MRLNTIVFVLLVEWEDFVSNSELRRKLLEARVLPLEHALNMNRFKVIGTRFRVPKEPLPCCTPSFEARIGWKMRRGDQSFIWQKA